MDLPPVLRQAVKTQNPLNGELSHGIVAQVVYEGVQAGRRQATGAGGFHRRGGASVGGQPIERGEPTVPGCVLDGLTSPVARALPRSQSRVAWGVRLMSRSLASKSGSGLRVNARIRCGCSSEAFRIAWTVLCGTPACSARAGPRTERSPAGTASNRLQTYRKVEYA